MAFKGTRRRSARDIAETIENVGGDLNAETGIERTSYFARALESDAELALDVIGDLLTDSAFDPVELAKLAGALVLVPPNLHRVARIQTEPGRGATK